MSFHPGIGIAAGVAALRPRSVAEAVVDWVMRVLENACATNRRRPLFVPGQNSSGSDAVEPQAPRG
jgi:hypothetical protein